MAYKKTAWDYPVEYTSLADDSTGAFSSWTTWETDEVASVLLKYSIVRDDNVADRVETGYMFVVLATGAADVAQSPALQTAAAPGVTWTMSLASTTATLTYTTTALVSTAPAIVKMSIIMKQYR